MIVLDPNVLCEALHPRPSPRVKEWLRSQPAAALFTTAITKGEIQYGLELARAGRRCAALQNTVAEIFETELAGRVLPFDGTVTRILAVWPQARVAAEFRSPSLMRGLPPSAVRAARRRRPETLPSAAAATCSRSIRGAEKRTPAFSAIRRFRNDAGLTILYPEDG